MSQTHFIGPIRSYICTPLFHDTDETKQRLETAHQSELFAHQRASVLPPALLPPYTDVPSCPRSPDTPGPYPRSFSLSLSLSLSLSVRCMPRDPTRSLKASFRAKFIAGTCAMQNSFSTPCYDFIVRVACVRCVITMNCAYKFTKTQDVQGKYFLEVDLLR